MLEFSLSPKHEKTGGRYRKKRETEPPLHRALTQQVLDGECGRGEGGHAVARLIGGRVACILLLLGVDCTLCLDRCALSESSGGLR